MFPSPSPGLLSHPRARHYRRYLEVVLLAMLRVYLLSTPRVDRYRGRSPARMRPGDSPGPRRPFVGSGWTRTDRVKRVLLAGSARARARDIARAAPRKTGPNRAPTGAARRHGPRPAADGSPVRLPHWPAYQESLLASRCERERQTSERLQAATPWQPAADSSEPVLLRAEVPRAGGSRPAASRTCPGKARGVVSRASVPPRLRQYPNTRCQCPRRAND